MFNTLYAKVFRLLRKRSGLTQEELGDELGISRWTVGKIEAGRAWLDADREERFLELTRCSKEESCELLCQALSEDLGKRVGIDGSHGAYEPATALARVYAVLREYDASLPASMRRTLNKRIEITQLMGYVYDKNNADLVELAQDCREALAAIGKEKDDDEGHALIRA